MKNQAPFLDISSFTMEEGNGKIGERELFVPPNSPFLSLYESEEGGGLVDPVAEEYVVFLNELYDEEFDEALSGLVNEAAAIYETYFMHEQENIQMIGYTERLLDQHFAPLVAEAEAMFEAFAREFRQHDPSTLTEDEIDTIVDRYRPSVELSPSFEEFLGNLKKGIKKVAKKAVSLAKKGITAMATGGISLILPKLKQLIKPLLMRVIRFAIRKLPASVQPIAKKLAERLPLLKEVEDIYESVSGAIPTYEVAEIQQEFDQQVANILFSHTEVEQDLEVAKALTDQETSDTYPLAELDRARDLFIENLRGLKEGEDPTPYVENFLPAVLPALQMGIRLMGRKKVVGFLAKLMGRLIQKFVGPKYAPALSQAIVDAGLRLIQLEATPVDNSRAAAEAIAATIEETVRGVAAAPNYILDNQEFLEGTALETFEQAASANLPPVLPEDTYRKRPELRETKKLQGVWVMMPRNRRKRYKKYSRKIPTQLTPYKVADLETFEGVTLDELLEEQLGITPGEEVKAIVHLYEAISGTRLSDIAQQEENTPGFGSANGRDQLHPLTRQAATLLLGEPDLGREIDPHLESDRNVIAEGQRFYYLEIPGKRPLTIPGPAGRVNMRRATKVRLILDFPKNEVRVYLFLSEIRSQEVAVKLRQHAHIGTVTARLRRYIERGLHKAIKGSYGRLKVIHESVTPDQRSGALQRLPSLVPQVLLSRLQEWVVKGLADHLKRGAEEFIKATEDTADGVTVVITLGNIPGFAQLRQALKGKGLSLPSLKVSDGVPTIKIKINAGYIHE
ncbi:MAG: hypothetical protein ACOY90_21135 [Candidatus Zhuqueibacterota bacterium]